MVILKVRGGGVHDCRLFLLEERSVKFKFLVAATWEFQITDRRGEMLGAS